MLYRSRISRSRFTGAKSFGASIMFFTSGRPTRSTRTLNSPRGRVSATTPTRGASPRNPASSSTAMLSTFLPSRKIEPWSVKASFRVAIVANAARASMMNGSHRTPAKTRRPLPAPPFSSLTRKETSAPSGATQRPCCSWPPATCATCSGVSKTQSSTSSSAAGTNVQPPAAVSGRSRKRYSRPAEKSAEGAAIGRVLSTRVRCPGVSGLGNAKTSVMSAIGSARATGPEMWSDIGVLGTGSVDLVGGLGQQRSQRRVGERLRGIRGVQHLLKGRVDAPGLADLLHRAAVVARVGGSGLLSAEDEGLQDRPVREPVVALGVPEDHVEEPEGRAGGEEVLHVGVPRTVEAGNERQSGVVVEEHEPGLVDGLDGHVVVAGPVAGGVLQVPQRRPQGLALTGLDVEEQTELARRADRHARAGGARRRCRHRSSSVAPTWVRAARHRAPGGTDPTVADPRPPALIRRG